MGFIYLMRIMFALVTIGGIVLLISALRKSFGYNDSESGRPLYVPALGLFFVGLLGVMWSSSGTQIKATERGIVENTASGKIKVIGPGIHLWPFQPAVFPGTSKVTKISLRNQRIEIGNEDPPKGQPRGIEAGSNTPGNPSVYIQARGWAAPSPEPEALIALYRQYGSDFLDDWVERNFVETSKAVQGQHPYDFLVGNRNDMASEIEQAVQESLTVNDKRLVIVSQLAITNFDYDSATKTALKAVAQKEFDRQEAAKDKAVALEQAEAEKTRADTRTAVAVKDAETLIAKAKGEAESINVKYGDQLRSDAYLRSLWIEKWDGKLPGFLTDDTGNVLVQIPQGAGQ